MKENLILILFAIIWSAFCLILVDMYDKLCYIILDKLISTSDKKTQIQISKFLGD